MEMSLDPYIIECCFSNEDAVDWEETSDRSSEIQQIRYLRKHLPEEDKELYNLIYLDRKTQNEVAELLDCTQATISYRVKSLTATLKFLLTAKELRPYPSTVKASLNLLSGAKRRFIECFLHNPSQVYVAAHFDVTPSNVSKCISQTLRDDGLDQDFRTYLNYLKSAPALVKL